MPPRTPPLHPPEAAAREPWHAPAEERLPRRAALAVSLAPVLVVGALTLVVGGLLEPDTGLAGVLAAVAWLMFEMHRWQTTVVRDEARHAAASGFDVRR